MAGKPDIDDLIREALQAEDAEVLERLGEPGLPDMVTEIFRGRMRWYGAMFLAMILVFGVLTVVCGVRFLGAEEAPSLIRWGVGFLVCFLAVQGGKNWYWMQMERLAMTREIKRVELLVAQLITDIRGQA